MTWNWSTFFISVAAVIVVLVIIGLVTKKQVDPNTGVIKTKFVGFEGDKKDNATGEEGE
jgi:hypothetical protein